MTPPTTSALPLRGAPRSVSRRPSRSANAALVAERLAARRQRTLLIRKWVVAFAITLFLAVTIVIVAQSHLVSASSGTSSATSSSSASAGTSSSSGTSFNSGTSSSSSSVSPVTSSQS